MYSGTFDGGFALENFFNLPCHFISEQHALSGGLY
jgi:hypothetical protein